MVFGGLVVDNMMEAMCKIRVALAGADGEKKQVSENDSDAAAFRELLESPTANATSASEWKSSEFCEL